ncbi:hypothetical protein LTR70_010220 [Exophiala xenobiotica]|uniref:Uncharacterized protein n=1 Tax=Lithohypha guttulata TaxID=1690604 RepID=A0ABR0JV51_9EURO|nr:hypothetical protein LTR24_010049 [Lithohypha guttulata]KAK5309525.1 hypothetical protein LTR70_010220 [Exophiala xenobiotica]
MQGGRRTSNDGWDSSSSWELVEPEQHLDANISSANPSDVSANTKKNCTMQGGTKDNDQAHRVKSDPPATGSDKHESNESHGDSGNKKGRFVPVLCANAKKSTSVAKNGG